MASKKTGVPASTVCFAFCRSSLPAKRTFFLPPRIYARRISEATSVSRGDSELHVATVILFSFRWNRPVFPSVSKLNGNHADLGSISRCDKTGRDSIQRYQLLSLSLSLSLFLELFGLRNIFSIEKFPSVFSTRCSRYSPSLRPGSLNSCKVV